MSLTSVLRKMSFVKVNLEPCFSDTERSLLNPTDNVALYVEKYQCESVSVIMTNNMFCSKFTLLYTPLFSRTVIFAVLARCGNSRVVNFAI